MDRRKFLQNAGLAIGATALPTTLPAESSPSPSASLDTWADIRSQFQLTPNRIHLTHMFLTSHPAPVKAEIEKHRKGFDDSPVEYWENNWQTAETIQQQAAARYIGSTPEEVALTDSTTMGLSILYHGLKLKPGDEILTSIHDHRSTEKNLEYAAARNGATIRRVPLYQSGETASVDEIAGTVAKNLQPRTRIVALTWVHSGTGVKLPLRAIADVIAKANSQRNASERIYFCVDGVHGFGTDNASMTDLGCDFFAAGTHKWIFGPRGTGILFARKDCWDLLAPTIPSFSYNAWGMQLGLLPEAPLNFGDVVTPGGFHSFEHRWALHTAFDFHMKIGKAKVQERTYQLSTLLKNGLSSIKHIKLHTPMSTQLSSGINTFEVEGMKEDEVVKKLHEKHHIIASTTPYRTSYARLTPSIVNTDEDVMMAVRALENIKS